MTLTTNATRTYEAGEAPDTDGEADDYTDDTEYSHLAGVLAAYAESAPQSSVRARLHRELVTGYLPVAHHIARRYANRGEPLEDLKQVACVGLVAAINRYQPELSRNFLGYLIPTITGEIRRHFRDKTWSMRVPRRLKELNLDITKAVGEMTHHLGRAPRPSEIAANLRVPVNDVLEALEAAQAYRAESLDRAVNRDEDAAALAERLGEPDNRFELVTSCQSLAPHLAELPDRERQILLMRFYDDMTQTQIATRFGISQMHVSRLLAKTLEHLRSVLTTDTPAQSEQNGDTRHTATQDRSTSEHTRARVRSGSHTADTPRAPRRAA